MTEPVQNYAITRGADAPGGKLVMSDEAVNAFVSAYRRHADTLADLADQVFTKAKVSHYGDLESLKQLAQGFHNLMLTSDESLHTRLIEFSTRATEIADKLQSDWERIKAEDAATSIALGSAQA